MSAKNLDYEARSMLLLSSSIVSSIFLVDFHITPPSSHPIWHPAK